MQQTKHQPRAIRIDYEQLRREVSIAQVLSLVAFRPVSMKGNQLLGPCPVHKSSSERSRSFSVNTDRDIYRCFGCDSKGNQLDLAKAVFGLPLYESAIELCRKLGIEPPEK